MRPSTSLAAFLLALVVAGCAERAFGPGEVSGAYGLLRYDNDSLPRTYTTGTGCWAAVVYGSLVLSTDGTFDLQIVRDQACPNSPLVWDNIDASGTYGQATGPWLALQDRNAGTSYLAWLKGTHVVVLVPQIALIGGGAVEVEFAAGAGNQSNGTTVIDGNGPCCVTPPPPPDTSAVVIIVKRP
ncbi:MAG: hypothetical protein ABSG61_15310 [Gemmatimonadales bacterium]